MSIIVASGEQICKSPLNHSQSKQMFSFNRAERFEKLRLDGISKNYFYNLPSMTMKRATTLGKGSKFDFTKEGKNKNSQFYNLGSDFDQGHPHSPKWTFGISRNHYEKVYYESGKILDKSIPGPGIYDVLKPFGREGPKYSIRGRSSEDKEKTKKLIVPGPGEYTAVSTSMTGKYPLSKYKNTCNIIWSYNKSKKLDYENNKVPGPQKYESKTLINGKGIIFNSKFRSSPGKTIAGRNKLAENKLKTPGPGAYRSFSEFGIYESKNAGQSPAKSETNE